MIRVSSATLISRTKKKGVFDANTTTERNVLVEVSSIGYREAYVGMANGLRPELKLKLAVAEEYDEEPMLKYNGKRYRVIRYYLTDDGGVELTVERDEEDA